MSPVPVFCSTPPYPTQAVNNNHREKESVQLFASMADAIIRETVVEIINELGFGTPLIIILGIVGIASFGNIITWFLARSIYSQYEKDLEKHDANVLGRIEHVTSSVAKVASEAALKAVSGVRDVADTLVRDFPDLLRVFVVAFVMSLIVSHHHEIIPTLLRIRCGLTESVNILLHLVNFARLLADAIVPIFDVVVEFMARLSPIDILLRTLKQCAAEADFFALLDAVALVFSELGIALYTFFSGSFLEDRLPFQLVAMRIGYVANGLIPVAECYCLILMPVFTFVLEAIQETDFHMALDAAVNVIIRVAQIPLAGLFNMTVPDFSNLATEINALLTHGGDWVETVVREFVNMLSEIISTIIDLLAVDAVAVSLNKKPVFPKNLEQGSITDPDFTSQAGKVEPATLSEVLHALHRTWASPLRQVAPGQVHVDTPVWQLPENSTLNETVGSERILLLFYAPWSRIATQPVAAAVSLANQTLNVITHSYNFSSPYALAYFQFGPVFTRLRDANRGLASLTVIFANEVPAFVEALGNVYITWIEALSELIPGFTFAIIFPCWRPGLNDLGNCNVPPSVTPCDCNTNPTTCTWTPVTACGTFEFFDIFNFFPAYADWTGSALQESIRYGEQSADELAIMLGCNQTEIDDDNCTSKPFHCVLRTTSLLGMEVLNQTHRLLFYIPDLVRFNHTAYHTMNDIGLEPIIDYALLLADCLSQWYRFVFLIN